MVVGAVAFWGIVLNNEPGERSSGWRCVGCHVAYKTAGYLPGIILNITYGLYLCFNMWILGLSAQRLCRRCQISDMTYPDVGEASFALFPNPKVASWSRCYRNWVNFVTCTHLFGACAAYQLMIAKSIKQLVEGSTKLTIEGQGGHPNLRVYIAAMMIPIIFLCLITQIKYLAPFSLGANAVIGQDERYSGNRSRFQIVARTLEEENAYDVGPLRKGPRSGVLFSIMNLAKGALGGGVLAGHVAYQTAGYVPGVILNVIYGIYMCFNFYILVVSAQRMCKRCHVADMTYPDVGEAAFALFPNPKVARWSNCYRKWIDFITCTNLFGSCAAYQLMIAKSIKQLVESSTKATLEGQFGYPHLRVYIAALIIPIILLCLITDIKYLAPFSIVANAAIAATIIATVHYAFKFNPNFQNMVHYTDFYDLIKFTGMSVFSMSCAGVVIPVENNMKDPSKYKYVIFIGYIFIIGAVFMASFFGYAAFLDKCTSPLTMNFPFTLGPKLLKWGIIVMIYVTYALNFFMPFQCVFYYIKPKFRPEKHYKAELAFRALFVALIGLFSIIFPNIDALMGFLGCFCLSNMAFICPNTIYVLVHYERPGKDKKYMIARAVCLSLFGVFILICGSIVNGKEMVNTLIESFSHTTAKAAGDVTTAPKGP